MQPPESYTETVEVRGHIIDSLIMPKILDDLIDAGADYEIQEFTVGKTHQDTSYSRIRILAPTQEVLDEALDRIHAHGAAPIDTEKVALEPAPATGVLPEGFYSTTNLPTEIRLEGRWVPVTNPEMDCAILVEEGAARTIPMSDVQEGQMLVTGRSGIRVSPLQRPRGRPDLDFEFMASAVSTEKPKELQVVRVASEMKRVREEGSRILWVVGPAVIHTGSGVDLAALVDSGWVDVLFAGNGFAAHDIESSMFHTSLGIDLEKGTSHERGHEHHIRAINEVRRAGGIAEAVKQGVVSTGVMHALVKNQVPFVLGGSVRDDGPLPDTLTDMLETQRRMRELIDGVGLTIVVASMLHGIATGNILPAAVPLVCVDINPATVTKLLDRGSHQSVGLVTDVGLFVKALRDLLT